MIDMAILQTVDGDYNREDQSVSHHHHVLLTLSGIGLLCVIPEYACSILLR